MTKLRTIWKHTVSIVLVLADWTQSVGMVILAMGAWGAAIKFMGPLLRDSFPGFLADVLMFCLVAGPIVWAARRLHRMINTVDTDIRQGKTGETDDCRETVEG